MLFEENRNIIVMYNYHYFLKKYAYVINKKICFLYA